MNDAVVDAGAGLNDALADADGGAAAYDGIADADTGGEANNLSIFEIRDEGY